MLLSPYGRTTDKTKIIDTMSLGYSSVCNIGDKVVWVSIKERYILTIQGKYQVAVL